MQPHLLSYIHSAFIWRRVISQKILQVWGMCSTKLTKKYLCIFEFCTGVQTTRCKDKIYEY